jgi:hypothetical protein
MYHVLRYTKKVIASFAHAGTKDIFDGCDTKAARRTCPYAPRYPAVAAREQARSVEE